MCSRACAMRLGGDGWQLVRVEGLQGTHYRDDPKAHPRTPQQLAKAAADNRRYRERKKEKRSKPKPDHMALMAVDGNNAP